MTEDMMMGERDLEAELKEKDEIIMSLRLNEHLLKDKLEISRRNMKKQLERITALEKENEQLQKETVFLAYWKRKAMILLMQVRRLTPRMTDKEVMEFSKELDDE